MQNTLDLKSLTVTKQNVASQALWIALFTVLTIAGSWLEIPTQPVPFTLQTFFESINVFDARSCGTSCVCRFQFWFC